MKCAECKFWDSVDQTEGECRRYAPKAALLAALGDGELESTHAHWPTTLGIDWCGEFEAVL